MIRFLELAEPVSLKEARAILKKSIEDVAAGVGVSCSLLQKWENGLSYPTIEQFMKLCDYYGIDYSLMKPLGNASGITLFQASNLLRIAFKKGITCNELLQEISLQ